MRQHVRRCLNCGHANVEHWFFDGVLFGRASRSESLVRRLDLHEEMHTRIDQLAFAVQVLTERLDAGRIESLEHRLDAFVSSWPRAGAQ